jgi:hypothetical protein
VLYIRGSFIVRVLKTKVFARYARKEHLTEESLCEAVERANRGLIDADLGGSMIKQRVARQGRGRSGGFRVIVVWRRRDRAVFLHGFAKNERGNVSATDLADLKGLAAMFLSYSDQQIDKAVSEGELTEVNCGGQED